MKKKKSWLCIDFNLQIGSKDQIDWHYQKEEIFDDLMGSCVFFDSEFIFRYSIIKMLNDCKKITRLVQKFKVF